MGKFSFDVDDENFDKEVIEKSKKVPVVVDFWASWCMPCLILKPTLEKIAEEYKGRFLLAKANIDENQKMSEKFNITSVPNVKLFINGKVVDEFIGAMPELKIKTWIDEHLK
ncbi:MAG: thioredoxin [Candidatus Aenigmatarchaeota archaeon]|nr:thioredoxin [Candidatus Aenigmarchaeota archaeon]